MKKIVCMLLCVLLLGNASALAAESFAASDAADAQRKALALMQVTAFASEYGDNGKTDDGHALCRWETPLRIYVDGRPNQADRKALKEFVMQLALRVPMMPNVTLVTQREDANVTIWYGPLDQMAEHVTNYPEGNWGAFRYWYTSCKITRAEIGIATDVTTQKARNHLMMEELVGILGLTNDHEVYADSIVYQPWTTTQELSEVDWLMLNMLYHPDAKPGMSWEQFQLITHRRISNR